MSIRFHKGPSIITLFHDSSSPTSKAVLSLLSSYTSRPSSLPSPSLSPPSNGESCIIEAQNGGAGEYLRQASSDPPSSSSQIQLEIVDRNKNPPTPDQMRSIIDYLTTDTSQNQNQNQEYTNSGFNLKEHERRKLALKPHLDASNSSGMPKLKDGPVVVNWDEGTATTSLEGVKEMLKRLEQQAAGKMYLSQ